MNNDSSEDLSTSMGIEYINNVRSTYKTFGTGMLLFFIFLVVIFFIGVIIYLRKYKI